MTYFLRSILTLLILFGLLAALLQFAWSRGSANLTLVTGLALGVALLQYLTGPWIISLLFNIDWHTGLPGRNQDFLREQCRRHGLPQPRMGIIEGAMPNAFTFGRLPSDARIVVTTGLLEGLTPEEVNAVIAHELGHIKHYDFLTMTIASIVPLLLYHLYALLRRVRDDQLTNWIAYGAYWLSQFLILSLSRTREFWADSFAGRATGNATALTSALVKICYGMTILQQEGARARAHGTKEEKAAAAQTALLAGRIGVMGISTAQASLALTGPKPAAAAAMMRWDLESPWARIYQLASTHPLTALRIKELNREAKAQGHDAVYPLPEQTRVRWEGFPVEALLWMAPWTVFVSLLILKSVAHLKDLAVPRGAVEALCATLLLSWLARILFRYQGEFKPAKVLDLVQDPTISQMRPHAVRIEGEIVGLGEPGAFWSPDLVIKDDTGMLYLLDRQTIPLARIVHAMNAERWVGQRVTLEGWFRRGLAPYIELSCLQGVESGDAHRSYSRYIQAVGASLICVLIFALSMR